MIYGYGRVSTFRQAKDGNSLEVQTKLLKENGAEIIYLDTYTGKTIDRPEYMKLKKTIKAGDTLIITKLDRIARSVSAGINAIEELINDGVIVYVLNIGKMDDSASGKLFRTIMLAFAEFERDMIIERTQEGKRLAANKEGFRDGRPKKYSREQIQLALDLLQTRTYHEVSKMTGISISTIQREYKNFIIRKEKIY